MIIHSPSKLKRLPGEWDVHTRLVAISGTRTLCIWRQSPLPLWPEYYSTVTLLRCVCVLYHVILSSIDIVISLYLQVVGRSYYSNDIFGNEDEVGACAVSLYRRRACGPEGIHLEECIERGCCWEPCSGCEHYIPWCFSALFVRSTPPPRRPPPRCERNHDSKFIQNQKCFGVDIND